MKKMSGRKESFNNFRFEGLKAVQSSNKYLTMNRVSEDETKIVVKVADEMVFATKYGYGLILDDKHVVFLKSWQVSDNYYGTEVLLNREYFNVKEWGDNPDYADNVQNLNFEHWLETAKVQDSVLDEDGMKANKVHWEI